MQKQYNYLQITLQDAESGKPLETLNLLWNPTRSLITTPEQFHDYKNLVIDMMLPEISKKLDGWIKLNNDPNSKKEIAIGHVMLTKAEALQLKSVAVIKTAKGIKIGEVTNIKKNGNVTFRVNKHEKYNLHDDLVVVLSSYNKLYITKDVSGRKMITLEYKNCSFPHPKVDALIFNEAKLEWQSHTLVYTFLAVPCSLPEPNNES